MLGKLGDRDAGLHEDGSHLEPVRLLLFTSPSYSDISLSEVGSHLPPGVNFLGLNCGVGALLVLGVDFSWYTGISMSTVRLGGSMMVFLGTGTPPFCSRQGG